jgi:thiol-disulfide isomerase/thioredoxin
MLSPVRPRRRAARARLAAAVLAAALGCAEGERPSYTRVDGPAPAIVDRPGAVLVVFWASWCPPCRDELPGLRALARDPPVPLSVVTFGEDEEEGAARAFFGGAPPPELGFVPDPRGVAAAAFGVDVLPATFLVVEGRLVARFQGERAWNSTGMRRLLGKLASERPPRQGGRGPAGR